ncbi:phage tail protein [Nocardia fluminea]|uniref:phage tail protein n=1 Tax=Nocardia fluminea TaxID=134984 RepID=UPI0036561281
MTQPGGIAIDIFADGGDLPEDMARAVRAALLEVQKELDRNPLNVKTAANTAGLAAEINTAIRAMNIEPVQVEVRGNTTGFAQAVNAAIAAQNISPVDVEVRPDTSSFGAQLSAQMAAIAHGGLDVEVRPDMTGFEAQVNAAIAAMDLGPATIPVDLDSGAALAQMAALRAALEAMATPITQEVTIEADRDGSVGRLSSNMSGLKVAAIGLGVVPAAIAGIGGAAGAAAGLVGGLVAGLLAVGPAAAAIGAAAAVGLSGIKDAFSAFSAQSKAAGTEGAAQAKAIESAQRGAESAARSLTSAEKAAQAATEDVTRARKAATDQLEDMKLASASAALSEKEAGRALQKARQDLAKAKTGDDRVDAALRIERAELNLAEAQERNRDQQEKARDAEEKGIENSDLVVAAKDKETAANEAVTVAQAQLATAMAAVTEAQNKQSASTTALNQALAKLSPNAREFVLAAHDLGDEWKNVRMQVQDNLFAGLGDTLTRVSGTILPALQQGLGGVATQMNGVATGALEFLGSARGVEGMNAIFANTENLLKGMQAGTGGFTQGLLDLTTTAGPHMEAIGRSIASIGESIGEAFSASAASGQLDSIFASLGPMLTGIGDALGGLISGLLTIAEEVMPSLGPMFTALGETFKIMAPGLGTLGKAFADALTPLLPILGKLINDLAIGFAPLLPVISNLLGALAGAITPLIGPFVQLVGILGTALTDAIIALTPAIGPLATAFASIVAAIAPSIPLIAELISGLVQALAPAITEIFTALAPVIAQLAEQFKPILEQMMPIITEAATIIGKALADAIRQLAPMLPGLVASFSNLLLAILPILPELAKMAAELLPPLVDVLIQLTPAIIKIIDAFTWLVQNVIIPYVLPMLRDLKDEFKLALEVIADVLEWWRGKVDVAVTWVMDKWATFKSGLVSMKDWFANDFVPGIVSAADGLKGAFAIPIRWVVDNAWNNGLLKAWNAAAKFLPGVEEMQPVTLGFAKGGGVNGPGSGTSDDILAWLSNGEHVLTAREVAAAGGQNVVYAIRDLIARGIPFEWNNGQLVSTLGRDNLDAYGAAVAAKGIGNVAPEGLFDPLLGFANGGAVLPWMLQLQKGHEFARAQNGKPYQWAGPRFTGDSFDCSGFMGSIIAAITGGNPWARYWATSSFAGYPQTGAQGLVRNLIDGSGMAVGITDDPGGPGGGHTAGELRGIPELGIPAARVESGGSIGDVHYGRGTDPNSFASLYGLPIGANGFFQPSTGGSSAGPSPADQVGFLERKIRDVFGMVVDPIRARIASEIGTPPPLPRKIPPEFLTTVEDKAVGFLSGFAGNLGELLPSAWTKAQETGAAVLDALNPFDTGGIANGTGIMAKNTIEPERVLSPEQTRLFEALVAALESISGGSGAAASTVIDAIGSSVGGAVTDALSALVPAVTEKTDDATVDATFLEAQREQFDEQGRLISDTTALASRTQSSTEKVLYEQFEQIRAQLVEVANKLTSGVLGPVVQSAMSSALGIVEKAIEGSTSEITAAQEDTTKAVENIDVGSSTPAFGESGSAFDLATELSNAVVSVANTAGTALIQLGNDIAKAALEQRASRAPGQSRGTLGSDEFSGGPLIDMIVRLTGVEIEVRELIESLAADMREFRGDEFAAFDETGALISDTTALVERTASSMELVVAEQNRINRALIASVLRYLMVNVILPILTALMTVMITLVVTALGAFIGTLIGGPVGTAIGAAVGAMVGLALSAVAAGVLAAVGLGAGAAIDTFQGGEFDSGGIAHGVGLMPKNTIEPERVLSPRQTQSFDQLVQMLDRGQVGLGHRTVQVGSQHFYGQKAPQLAADDLLSKLN